MGANDPQDMANLDPRDLCRGSLSIATCALYISCGPHGFRVVVFSFIVNIR